MTLVLIAAAAYLIPTFILGYVWHLKLFESRYKALEIYRDDVIVPFGLLSMTIQAVIFGYLYINLIQTMYEPTLARAAVYFAGGAVLSWSFSTLAVGAKNKMSSVKDFVVIETVFTLVQWLLIAGATALVVG